ncbi:LysR family transcriptional regulator [Cognatishimia activa]|uniref:D-malate degradation protein R n=1 Tax=Cognatishimia activa TaxID=1715691 RepID=A0A0P1IVH9_9RHOB|nr:LysR family transcriptional regulator [Cognatishimia activa]MEE2944442.1 LysR family transcriptional regulator [Pseudomonadota bacterium]CUJ06962.1 D-malate degradation protein R [Cognatishimia activa]CUK25991.1 D-malate degradation protein R [Cognatishimia activa]
MSTSPKQPDWNHIRAFLATAETGSLSAAARELGLTQPTLSRQVAALEEELGVMLFERIGRTLELTTAGVEMLEHTQNMGLAADRISLVAQGQSQAIEGEIRITASDVFSGYLLPEVLKDLRAAAPDLSIDIVAVNDVQDIMRREADIAIRHVRPEQPDLIARLVAEPKAYFYASKSYLQKHGHPKDFADLSNFEFISFGDKEAMKGFLQPLGIDLTDHNFRIGSANGLVAWQLCVEGFGIAAMSEHVADRYPDLVKLLPEADPIVFPTWLVTHRELHTSRRIRLVYDMLAEFLARKK